MKYWLLALLLLPATARAEDQAVAQKFAAVLQNPGHRQLVLQAAQATPAWVRTACAAAKFTPAPEIAVFLPVNFDDKGAPVAGQWRESLVATGCGAPMQLNVVTQVTGPSMLSTGFVFPGSSIASPVLQNAGQAYAVKAAGGIPSGCNSAYVADTAFSGYDQPQQKDAGWKETWTLDLCGPPQRVALHFAPDANGISIAAALAR